MNLQLIKNLIFSAPLTLLVLGSNLLAQDVTESSFDVRKLEKQVNEVISKVSPATVGLVINGYPGGATAVIVSAEGHVLTAGHCIETEGTTFTLELPDGRSFPAEHLGFDLVMDCGMLKIKEEALVGSDPIPFVKMGWSSVLEKNEPCVSLGHSGGYNGQRGFVARFGRIVKPVTTREGAIQSTCLMEPGDSGGPLFNMQGELIAIHSSIDQGLQYNYEIPIDLFRRYWPQLLTPKKFSARKVSTELGVTLQRSNSAMGSQFSFTRGVRIEEVEADGWAAKQGLQPKDRILKFGNQRVGNPGQLRMLMTQGLTLGLQNVALELKREKKVQKVELDFSSVELEPSNEMFSRIENSVDAAVPELADLVKQVSDLEERLDDHCVMIRASVNARRNSAVGTVFQVKDRTVVVSKSSLVSDTPYIRLAGSKESLKASIIKRDEIDDLVLLQIDGDQLGSIAIGIDELSFDQTTRFLLSPSPRTKGRIGIVGTRPFANRQAFLGVYLDEDSDGVFLRSVQGDGPAETSGLKAGDHILEIDGTEIDSSMQMIELLRTRQPGEEVLTKIRRDKKDKALTIKLGAKSIDDIEKQERQMMSGHAADDFPGGKSKRSTGFSKVIVHDTPVSRQTCGGPIFDMQGRLVGLNIARVSRTRSYALPADVIVKFLRASMETGSE